MEHYYYYYYFLNRKIDSTFVRVYSVRNYKSALYICASSRFVSINGVPPRPLTVRRREKILLLLRRLLPRARMLDRSLSLGRRWHPTCVRRQSIQPVHREVLFHGRDRSSRHGSSGSAGLVFGHYLAHCNELPEKRSERRVMETRSEEYTFFK